MTDTRDINCHADAIISILFAAHRSDSDRAAAPLAAALREWGEIQAEAGTPGHDYTALICDLEEVTWLIEDNNARTRIYDPGDADYDIVEEIKRMQSAATAADH